MNAVYTTRRQQFADVTHIESVQYASITHWNIKEMGNNLTIYEPCMGERRFISKTNEEGEAAYNEWLEVMHKKYQQ